MSFNNYVPGKTNPHLPHDGVEIQQIPASAEDIELAKSDAEDLVRQLMSGDLPLPQTKGEFEAMSRPLSTGASRPTSKPLSEHGLFRTAEPVEMEPSIKPVTQCATNEGAAQMLLERPDVSAQSKPEVEPEPSAPADDRPIEMREDELVKKVLKDAFPRLQDQEKIEPSRGWDKLKAKVESASEGVAGKVMIGAVGVAVVTCVIWPFQVFLAGILALAFFLASMQLMRVPFLARIFTWFWGRYAARKPDRAERVRATADSVASVIEHVLDYLPGALADRLALPDFSKPITPNRG